MSYTFTFSVKNVRNNETLNNFPGLRDNLNTIFSSSRSILMVGWRYNSDHTFVKYMLDEGKDLTIVEIFEPNLKSIPQGVKTICGDILTTPITDSYDMFLWQHGPEHVKKEDGMSLLKRIEPKFKYLVMECPNGYNRQDEMYGNVHEMHVSHWETEDYENLGFYYGTYAGPDNRAFIIGYKETP